jgi:hypothetical protein
MFSLDLRTARASLTSLLIQSSCFVAKSNRRSTSDDAQLIIFCVKGQDAPKAGFTL